MNYGFKTTFEKRKTLSSFRSKNSNTHSVIHIEKIKQTKQKTIGTRKGKVIHDYKLFMENYSKKTVEDDFLNSLQTLSQYVFMKLQVQIYPLAKCIS